MRCLRAARTLSSSRPSSSRSSSRAEGRFSPSPRLLRAAAAVRPTATAASAVRPAATAVLAAATPAAAVRPATPAVLATATPAAAVQQFLRQLWHPERPRHQVLHVLRRPAVIRCRQRSALFFGLGSPAHGGQRQPRPPTRTRRARATNRHSDPFQIQLHRASCTWVTWGRGGGRRFLVAALGKACLARDGDPHDCHDGYCRTGSTRTTVEQP